MRRPLSTLRKRGLIIRHPTPEELLIIPLMPPGYLAISLINTNEVVGWVKPEHIFDRDGTTFEEDTEL